MEIIISINITDLLRTRTSVDQHKCLPLHACINLTPLLFEKIVVKKNDSEI